MLDQAQRRFGGFCSSGFSGQSAFSVEMQGLDKSTRIDAAFFTTPQTHEQNQQ